MAAVVRGGHSVGLLAPERGSRVLLGPGEVSSAADLDGPAVAAFLGGHAPDHDLADALRVDAALAVTRSPDLIGRLRAAVPRLLTCDPTPSPGVHASRWFADPLRELQVDPEPDPPFLAFTAEEEQAAGEIATSLPRRFLALHPGSGAPRKNWPVGRFAELARVRARGAPWLLVEGPADDAAAGPLSRLPGATLARNLPIRVLGALLSRAGLYVGNDSGVTHLAAAAGAPTLALFGPTDPATWAPVGPAVRVIASDNSQMDDLKVEKVLEAAALLSPHHA